MALSNRLRERREQLGLKQSDVALLLGITPGAVGNYENGVSTPKAEILFKVFDALRCDANYLFQDEMKEGVYKDSSTPEEFEKIIKKYRVLDEHGKEMVDFTLDKEYERSIALQDKSNVIPYQIKEGIPDYLTVNAAHEDENATLDERKAGDAIMTDDSEWE